MKYAARTATLIIAAFLAMTSTCGRAAGQGGGHGASGGGHGFGGHAGHSSVGSSSAHSSGHSIGHSLAHIFGHHGQGASSEGAVVKAPAKPWIVTPSPISVPQELRPRPRNTFISRHRVGCFPRRGAFGFSGCPYGWFDFHFRFDDHWNCPNDAFFFDPFFFGWSSRPLLYGPAFGSATWFEDGTATDSTVQAPAEPKPTYPPANWDATNETLLSSGSTSSSPNDMKSERPITLLQLRDGSMYGLTDYWVKDGELRYTTTYGGQGSVPFARIDLEKTVQLNADRRVPFVLRPESVPR